MPLKAIDGLTGALLSTLTGTTANATAASGVGSYAISQGSLAAANYSISFTGANLTVTPAPLTVTAQPQTTRYGAALPALTFSATGFVNGETVAILTGVLATNYRLSFTPATLTVTPLAGTTTRTYLPFIIGPQPEPQGPDLVIESIRSSDGVLEVVLANLGDNPVTTPFWVDLALGPRRAPLAPNDTWDIIGERGLSWGVTAPLAAGQRLQQYPQQQRRQSHHAAGEPGDGTGDGGTAAAVGTLRPVRWAHGCCPGNRKPLLRPPDRSA